MIDMRTVYSISEKTLNFVSMLFWKMLYFHNDSVDRMSDILFSSRWGNFGLRVQNRLVFKTKIQNISRYLEDFLRYLENVLGYLDIFWEFPERQFDDFTWYLCQLRPTTITESIDRWPLRRVVFKRTRLLFMKIYLVIWALLGYSF